MRPSKRLRTSLSLLTLAAGSVAVVGCTQIQDTLGISSSDKRTILTLQSIELRSDHPATPGAVTGPAVAGTNQIVRFTAIGTFQVDSGATTETNDVSAGVVWTTSDPGYAFPGADGRLVTPGSAGTVTVSASTPALGSIPALSTNAITLTVQ